MSKTLSIIVSLSLLCVTALPALADVSDYLGTGEKPAGCPKTIVVRPEVSAKTVFYPVSPSNLESASNMIGSAVASKYEGAAVISAKDFSQYKACDVPVVVAKLKSYTKQSAIFGQNEGKAAVTILHFKNPAAAAPDKQTEVSATGESHFGDNEPFMSAIQAVSDKIERTSL